MTIEIGHIYRPNWIDIKFIIDGVRGDKVKVQYVSGHVRYLSIQTVEDNCTHVKDCLACGEELS